MNNRKIYPNNISISILFIITILSPYIVWPFSFVAGYISAIILLFILYAPFLFSNSYKIFINSKLIFIFSFILFYPPLISFIIYTNIDIQIIKLILSIALMIIIGVGLAFRWSRIGIETSLIILLCTWYFYLILAHSVLIILEFYYPSLRAAIESVMAVDRTVDYLYGVRFRGVASAGGANLAFAHGLGGVIGFYLYSKKMLALPVLVISSATILMGMVFVGRTGFLVFLLGAIFVCIFLQQRKNIKRSGFLSMVIGISIIFSGIYAAPDVYESLPRHYQKYSIDLFLNGVEGLEKDGTLNTLISMYDFPDDFFSLMLGVGNYSGGFVKGYSWPSDPGIMKVFTAYGIPFGLFLYLLLLLSCLRNPSREYRSLFILICFLMFFVEVKEPLILKGYASRFLWILMGVAIYSKGIIKIVKWESFGQPKINKR